jgi:integrase/recombinase XerD
MTYQPLSQPLAQWPAVDRERWAAAQTPAGFLEPVKPASGWSRARRRIVEQAYGQWLGFLSRQGILDPSCHPGERVTDDRLRQFVGELRDRVTPSSASMMVGALLRMLVALEPERDWRTLSGVYNHLKLTAKPTRDKLACMVAAADLFTLGTSLMDTCEEVQGRKEYRSTQFRDGLLIATLISCPVRLKNLAMIAIGRHLLFDGQSYRLEFSGEEMKTGRPYIAEFPTQLTAYMDRYIAHHRTVLQLIARDGAYHSMTSGPLWINRHGQPMSSKAVRHQIKLRTEHAFGRAIWPHLFRDIAVSELVDIAPEEIGIAPDLLGHTSLATTQKHYLHAQGMKAHWAVQDALLRARNRTLVRTKAEN